MRPDRLAEYLLDQAAVLLILAFLEGDYMVHESNKKRFEDFALKSMDVIYTKALRLTKNAGDAENLVQATYLRAFEAFDKFEETKSCCRWWFLSILKSEFRERLYQKKPRLLEG